jgi:hypothetical protein
MIMKYFYDEIDYQIVMRLLNGMQVSENDRNRVFTRQMFLESQNVKKI